MRAVGLMWGLLALVVIGAFMLQGCPQPPNPAPMPPDATDGAPSPPAVSDAAPGPFDAGPTADDCAHACNVLATLGCPVELDCPQTYTKVEAKHETRTQANTLLTCAMVVAATSKAQVRSLSIGCP